MNFPVKAASVVCPLTIAKPLCLTSEQECRVESYQVFDVCLHRDHRLGVTAAGDGFLGCLHVSTLESPPLSSGHTHSTGCSVGISLAALQDYAGSSKCQTDMYIHVTIVCTGVLASRVYLQ